MEMLTEIKNRNEDRCQTIISETRDDFVIDF